MNLLNAVRHFFCQRGTEKTYWIAFSGGLDSHVLLDVCKTLQSELGLELRAIHINHGISRQASTWANHCRAVCQDYAIDYIEKHLILECYPGESLEAVAREQRYAVFSDCLGKNDVLLTAHHQDDQAETVLLQLLRGAGPKGLAAMPMVRTLARGFHARPLLPFTREILKQYACARQIRWIQDESNDNLTFSRNYLRHSVMPSLKKRWVSVAAILSRSAMHCAETQALLEEMAQETLLSVQGNSQSTLSVSRLRQMPSAKQRFLLRIWLYQQGCLLPDARKLKSIQQNVLTAAWDRMPLVAWGNHELRRYRDDLYVMPALSHVQMQSVYSWNLERPLPLPGVGSLRAVLAAEHGLRKDIRQVSVRFRQGGERVHLSGYGHRTLKNLLREWGVLPWERNRIPLIFIGDQLAAVAGYFMDDILAAKAGEEGWKIILEKEQASGETLASPGA